MGACEPAYLLSKPRKSEVTMHASNTEESPREGDKLSNYLTMVGHICSDINQGAISAVLPFLVVSYGYDYAAVALLVFAANIASAVIQPLFGIIGDKRSCPWLMALGVFLAGLGMCLIGFVDSYGLIVLAAMLSGIGVAMFHPEGGRLANLAAGEHKGDGMSIFAVGGNIGFFLGPLMVAFFLSAFGMHGTLVFLFPATACAVLLLCFNRRFRALGTLQPTATTSGDGAQGNERWGAFAAVMGVLSARSIVEYGLLAFIPLFLMGVMGQTEALSSSVLSVFAICGAVSTVLSGRASERFGSRRLMIACLALTSVLLVAFAFNRSLVAAVVIAMLLAVVSDLFYLSTVALGMSYVPRHLGTASGLSYGVAIAVGGMAEPFLGMAGDAVGLEPVIMMLAGVAAAGAVVGVCLGHARPRHESVLDDTACL